MKQLSAFLLLAGASLTAGAQSISSSNFQWTPSLLTVTAGTDITINVNGNHHMREVTEATWNANGNTTNGGFDFTVGTHTLTLTIPGTYYYVCVPHVASMSMKGRIIVESANSVVENTSTVFSILPNPASDQIAVTFPAAQGMQLALIDVKGSEVLRRSITNSDRIAIGHLAAGNYNALLIDAQGTIQERQRITIAR